MRIRKFNVKINKNGLYSRYRKLNGLSTNFDFLYAKYKDLPDKIEKTLVYDVYSKNFPEGLKKINDDFINSAVVYAAIEEIKKDRIEDTNTKNFLKAMEDELIQSILNFSFKLIEDTHDIPSSLEVKELDLDPLEIKDCLKLKKDDMENRVIAARAVFWVKKKKKN